MGTMKKSDSQSATPRSAAAVFTAAAPASASPIPAASPQPALPPAVLKQVAPHSYLYAHLNPAAPNLPIRSNGRRPSEHRPPLIHTGSLTHADGSAIVRQGGTAALCGIRAEILNVHDIPDWRADRYASRAEGTGGAGGQLKVGGRQAIEELGLLVPNVELRTGCTHDNLPDRPPSERAQALSAKLMTSLLLADVIDFDSLVIRSAAAANASQQRQELFADQEDEMKAFWVLYIDVLLLSLDGNPFDAAWTACMAALQDARLPRAAWDDEFQAVLCEDDGDCTSSPLSADASSPPPMSCSYAIFRSSLRLTDVVNEGGTGIRTHDGHEYWVLADPDALEEELCCDSLSILLGCEADDGLRLLSVEKLGGVTISMREIKELIAKNEQRWKQWRTTISQLKERRIVP